MNFLVSNTFFSSLNQPEGNPYSLLIILTIFGVIFYFFIFRPQNKRIKEHKRLINSVSEGDEILTSGGLVCKVKKVCRSGYIIVILNDKINKIIIKKDFITAILPKGTIESI